MHNSRIDFRNVITINIIDQEEYKKMKTFYIDLGEPRVSAVDDNPVIVLSYPRIDEKAKRVTITLTESDHFKVKTNW